MRKFMRNTLFQTSILAAALLATATTAHAALKECRRLPLYGCDAEGCWNDPCNKGDGWVTIYRDRTIHTYYGGGEKVASQKSEAATWLPYLGNIVVNFEMDGEVVQAGTWDIKDREHTFSLVLSPGQMIRGAYPLYPKNDILAAVLGVKKVVPQGNGVYRKVDFLTTGVTLPEDVLKQAELTTTDYLPAWRDFNFNERKYTVRDPDSSPFVLKMVEIIEYKLVGGAVRTAPRLDASGTMISGPGDKMGLNEISTLQELGNYDTCLVRDLATMNTLVCSKRPFRLSDTTALPEVLPTTPPISPIPMPTCGEHCVDTPTTPGPAAPVEVPRSTDGTPPSPKEPLGGSSPKYPAPGTTLPGSPGPGTPPPSGA